jgi:putative ABC transport system permease protein
VRPRRLATFAALGSLAWALSCYMVLPKAFEAAGVSGFVAQGIVATAATVALLAVHSEHWTRLGSALGHRRGGLSAHLGLAYPLARPFRTAMQMAMFGLVVFGLVFLAVLSHLFSSQAPRYIDEVGAGYEIVLDSSAGNPASPSMIAGQPGVAGVAPLVRALPEFSTPRHPELDRWYLTGYDARLLARGTPGLAERDPRFPDDRAVFEAVLRSPDLAVVPDWFLQEGGGTPEGVVEVGEWLTVRNPATGSTRRLKVAGIVGGDWALAGVMVGATAARELLGGDAVASRAMVAVAPGEDPDEVAARLTGRLVENGADAESVRSLVDRALGTTRAFMALSQGFIALGLVIGIGGLAVVMIRSVRERRRQIGMLRAMGFPAATVRGAFIVESAFVAARGLVVGGAVALLSTYLLVTRSDAMGADRLPFGAPWATLAGLLLATLAIAVVATLAPAVRASRIRPAVALRVSD